MMTAFKCNELMINDFRVIRYVRFTKLYPVKQNLNRRNDKLNSWQRINPTLQLFKIGHINVTWLKASTCNFIKKKILVQVFFCEFSKFLRGPFLKEHLRWLFLTTKHEIRIILKTVELFYLPMKFNYYRNNNL